MVPRFRLLVCFLANHGCCGGSVITEVEHQREGYLAETVVKIYMNDQDSIVPILHEGFKSLTRQIKDSREDSIDVKVVKKKVNE